ncbi:MAG: winged helix-turn-helix domain-containing protein [Gammaproteobacteria bacterium]|nr:winged helix-turn-helix domain-containing protein [Gammaproteobacteria bacterium]
MNNSINNVFRIGDWDVSPAEGLVTRNGITERLEPKAMEVLVYLAGNPGSVISRETLEHDVWHGALIGYDAVTNTVIKLRKALQDNARQPQYIVTVPKKGYQLIAPVQMDLQRESRSGPSIREPTAWYKIRVSMTPALLGIALAAGLALTLSWFGTTGTHSESNVPSIIVLPFVSLNNDPKGEALADGITEDIITDLSRMANLRVLGNNTAFRYKDEMVLPKSVGADLNVRFVLKGSIQKQGGNLRINAQLIDTSTGFNMWAERYDRKIDEYFSVQDNVTRNIVSALAVKLTRKEKQRLARKSTANLAAYDHFMEGQRQYKILTAESTEQAIDAYYKALELDPGYGRAHGALSVALVARYRHGWTDTPMETLDRALILARKAVELDDSTPQTHWALGFAHLARREFHEAELAATTSIEIAPNYADGYGLLALIKSHRGQAAEAIRLNDKAISLNPHYSFEYLVAYAIAYYTQKKYDKAVEVLETAHSRNPNHYMIKILLASSYLHQHRLDDSRWIVSELVLLTPGINLRAISDNLPFSRPDIVQRLLSDLREAGVPD